MTCAGCTADKVDELRRGIALNVKLRGEHGGEIVHVLPTDVTLIGTRMDGDALSTERLNVASSLQNVGTIPTSCITQRGNFIDIDT